MHFKPAILLLLATGLSACGAKLKTAGQVSGVFQSDAQTLQQKLDKLCLKVKKGEDGLVLSPFNRNTAFCANAGIYAHNYRTATSLAFSGLESEFVPENSTDKTVHLMFNLQIWLNHSVLDVGSKMLQSMKSNEDSFKKGSTIKLPTTSKSLEKFITPSLTVTSAPVFDPDLLQFSAGIRMQVSGAVTVDNTYEALGRVYSNAIVVQIRTTADAAYETSLIKNINATLYIIPHAGDLYVDVAVDMNIHDVGSPTLMKDTVTQFLTSGLKPLLDSLMTL